MCAIAITSDEDGDEIKVFFDWVNDLANDPKPPLVHSVYVVSLSLSFLSYFYYYFTFICFIFPFVEMIINIYLTTLQLVW